MPSLINAAFGANLVRHPVIASCIRNIETSTYADVSIRDICTVDATGERYQIVLQIIRGGDMAQAPVTILATPKIVAGAFGRPVRTYDCVVQG